MLNPHNNNPHKNNIGNHLKALKDFLNWHSSTYKIVLILGDFNREIDEQNFLAELIKVLWWNRSIYRNENESTLSVKKNRWKVNNFLVEINIFPRLKLAPTKSFYHLFFLLNKNQVTKILKKISDLLYHSFFFTIRYNVKHRHVIRLKFGDKFLTSLTKLVLERKASIFLH